MRVVAALRIATVLGLCPRLYVCLKAHAYLVKLVVTTMENFVDSIAKRIIHRVSLLAMGIVTAIPILLDSAVLHSQAAET